ncbi:hypothetical protein DRW03_16485 [Corallococcus sp. H22C18031201]|nr:hypothetical protein DRW03_16485 [Corallococcus sp. H22C18031201]
MWQRASVVGAVMALGVWAQGTAGAATALAQSQTLGAIRELSQAAIAVNTEQIRQVYRDTLGREAAQWEVNAWVSNLQSGSWTIGSMRAAFAKDPQCRAAISLGYQQVFERTPATSEVDAWQQNILYGWSIPSMRASFTHATEGMNRITAAFLETVHLKATPQDIESAQAMIVVLGRSVGTYRDWLRTQLRYNQVYQRSLHNAYEMGKSAGVMDQLVYYGIRDVEWDLRSQPISNVCGTDHHPANDWYVYHSPWQPSDYGRFNTLSDGLRLLAAFQSAMPLHEVFTLHLELKGGADGGSCDVAFPDATANSTHNPGRQTPEGLDARLRAQLGAALFTPSDLLALCPGATTLQQAVATCGWPLLETLRGKILVTLHAGNWNGVNYAEESYDLYAGPNSSAALGRTAFLAPLKFVNGWLYDVPPFAGLANNPGVVMHTEGGTPWRAVLLRDAFPGAVIRASGTNDFDTFNNAAAAQVYPWLQTDLFDWHANPLVRTDNALGYPFCPIGVLGLDCRTQPHALSTQRERRSLLEMTVRSGDIWGTWDDFVFAPSWKANPAERTQWTAFISDASNGNVHEWAKGCLMARNSFDANSPYYAVCRAGDNKQLFVQYRTFGCSGPCGTARAEASLAQGIQAEEATFVRLDVWPAGNGASFAQGYGSVDGVSWQAMGPTVWFQQELGLQGLAASSHDPNKLNADGSPTRFLFGNVLRNGNRQTFGFTPVYSLENGVKKQAEPLASAFFVGNVVSGTTTDLSYYGEVP